MNQHHPILFSIFLFCLAMTSFQVASASDNPTVPFDTTKPWTRWWWPGSAVDKASLTHQLESLAAAGIGGVEITPIYGARGYEERNIEFLSQDWMEMLQHVGLEAKRLGMGVDMATGTGWPFGGPWVPEEDAALKAVFQNGSITGVPTAQKVKRAAPGGEGWVLDPYSTNALKHYLSRFDEAFAILPTGVVRSQFHDSFEYYGASWSTEFAKRFEQMHGYSIQDHAAPLMDQEAMDEDSLARLKGDFRSTLSAMHLDYLRAWNQWAHTHGQLTRNQSHGAPANLLDLYAAADIPETEIFGASPFPIPGLRYDLTAVRRRNTHDLPEPLVTRFASSAAHITGNPLVSCESATWLRDHWKVALSYVKPELDRVLLDGINHIFYHGTVYSPDDVPWPGWLFYAATQFNPKNPWWQNFSELNHYVHQVQTVLQAGKPDNDVLLYWPEADVWHNAAANDKQNGPMIQLGVHGVNWIMNAPCGIAAKSLNANGTSFDYISDLQLARCSSVDNGTGHIRTSGGTEYAALVVPPTHYMPLETMRTLVHLAVQGANVVFQQLPQDVPGLKDLDSRRNKLNQLLMELEDTKAPSCHIEADLAKAIEHLAIPRETMRVAGLDCIRRKSDDGWDYFIVNLSANAFDGWVTLARPFQSVEISDPLTDTSGLAAVKTETREVYLQLKPGQSLILRTCTKTKTIDATWTYFQESGNDAVEIQGLWSIDFIHGGPTLPASFQTGQYGSWTDLAPDAEAKRFAGTARYTIEFEKPEGDASTVDWLLDLGDLRESARVKINGKPVGTVWSLPYQIRVGAFLKPGNNTLELEITNLAANRIRDMDQRGVDWKIMHEINFVNINYEPFNASGWAIEPAGLLSPVKWIPLQKLEPASHAQ